MNINTELSIQVIDNGVIVSYIEKDTELPRTKFFPKIQNALEQLILQDVIFEDQIIRSHGEVHSIFQLNFSLKTI